MILIRQTARDSSDILEESTGVSGRPPNRSCPGPVPGLRLPLVAAVAGQRQQEYMIAGAQRLHLAALHSSSRTATRWRSAAPTGQSPSLLGKPHRLSEAEFKQCYCLSPASFDKLVKILEPKLAVKDEKQAINSLLLQADELQVRLVVALHSFCWRQSSRPEAHLLHERTIYCQVCLGCGGRHQRLPRQHPLPDRCTDLQGLTKSFSRGGFWKGPCLDRFVDSPLEAWRAWRG